MRVTLISILLLSAAVPALATQPEDNDARMAREARADSEQPVRSERVEAPVVRPQRIQRAERPQRAERIERVERAERVERSERPELPVTDNVVNAPGPVERREGGEGRRGARPSDSVAGWRWQERRDRRDRRSADAPPSMPVAVSGSPVLGEALPQPRVEPVPTARRDNSLRDRIAAEGWRRDWRNDRRYDWKRHRDRDRSRFRVGIYIDPFGWNYRRWQVGWNMYPRHFSNRYWIDDPWQYRLPPVYGPYRWVRYYDDALLVDLRSGRVVDVIYRFFW